MRKISIAAVIIAALWFAVCGFRAAYSAGIRHAICDSCIWTVECYDPENPYANLRPDGLDQTIYIELDGNIYEHGMYQG